VRITLNVSNLEGRKETANHLTGKAGTVAAAHRADDRYPARNRGRLSQSRRDRHSAAKGMGTPHADKTGQRGDHRFAWNTRIVRNAANPIDSPQIIIVRKGVDGVNSFPHRVDDNQLVTPSQTGYFQDLQISVANSVECAVAVSVTQITVSRIYRGI
jgi:hypothetical protein